jgi:hypothetical protein
MTLTSRVTLCFWLRKVNLHSLKKVCFPPLPTTQIKERGRERKGSPPDIDKGGGGGRGYVWQTAKTQT